MRLGRIAPLPSEDQKLTTKEILDFRFSKSTVERFLNVKSNDPLVNMFPNPTEDREALDILCDHFLGEDWYTVNPMCHAQVLTEQVADIITHYESVKFKQLPWYKRIYLKLYCLFTNTPIYRYY